MIQNKTIGAILLIAGTAIGAGMLALPITTAPNGFILSTFAFLICWFFMIIAALLLIEVNLSSQGEKDLISMVGSILGRWGKVIACVAYLLLLYALICAYLQGSSAWFTKILEEFNIFIPPTLSIFILVLIFSIIIFQGTATVEYLNRYLFLGLIITYIILVLSSLPKVEYTKIMTLQAAHLPNTFPLIVTAFGFSVILPSLTSYLERNAKALHYAVIVGSFIPLGIYLLWEFVALGIIPINGPTSFQSLAEHHDNGTGVAIALEKIVGGNWIIQSSRWFAIFAILTSLLGISLSLFHFLADIFGVYKTAGQSAPSSHKGYLKSSNPHEANYCTPIKLSPARWRVLLLIFTYLPPLLTILLYPSGFGKILSFAGIFVAVLLGILPALMAWYHRYYKEGPSTKRSYQVFGGKILLIVVIIFFFYVTYLEIANCLVSPLL